MGIEIEYPLGYASSGGIVYFVTPAKIMSLTNASLNFLLLEEARKLLYCCIFHIILVKAPRYKNKHLIWTEHITHASRKHSSYNTIICTYCVLHWPVSKLPIETLPNCRVHTHLKPYCCFCNVFCKSVTLAEEPFVIQFNAQSSISNYRSLLKLTGKLMQLASQVLLINSFTTI